LAVLSSNPTPRVIPSAVIVKNIIFDIYWLSSGHAMDIWYLCIEPHQEQWNIVKYNGYTVCVSRSHLIIFFGLIITCPLGPYCTGISFYYNLTVTWTRGHSQWRFLDTGIVCTCQPNPPSPYIPQVLFPYFNGT
jgi:hypothetical protein